MLDPNSIHINFHNGINLYFSEPQDQPIMIQVMEYYNGGLNPMHLNGYNMVTTVSPYFRYFRSWYGEYLVNVWDWNSRKGPIKVFSHQYSEYLKPVLFLLEPQYPNDYKDWKSVIDDYVSQKKCKPTIKIIGDDYNSDDFYRIYTIKRHNRDSFYELWSAKKVQFHERIQDGNWREFWSYEHPRNWENLSARDIARDILGMNPDEWTVKFPTKPIN